MTDVSLDDVQRWLDDYVTAWESNDPERIAALFTDDADYYTAPYRPPWHGRDEILRGWGERSDPPGSFECDYRAVAVEGDLGVARGWTRYLERDEEYDNVYFVRMTDDGRCREFTEFWMLRE